MHKPRDYDSELQALSDKAKQIKDRKLHQLGELVIATGADVLPIELLAGALLRTADTTDAATKEGWRKRGAAFFQSTRRAGASTPPDQKRAQADDSGAAPVERQDRA